MSGRRRGFSLVELLAVVAVVGVMASLMLPSLSGSRGAARAAGCLSNQRQLALGWTLYAQEWRDRAMPLADERSTSRVVYWWGAVTFSPSGGAGLDYAAGFLTPYLGAPPGERGVYECAAQAWGTYRAQPSGLAPSRPTSTYGYNGYFLAPETTPGWNSSIRTQRWMRLGDLARPSEVFVFADTMLPSRPVRNCALLDPPRLFSPGSGWSVNASPTTAFRHAGSVATARGDGSARAVRARPEWLTHADLRIGSVGLEPGPHYVEDWTRWR